MGYTGYAAVQTAAWRNVTITASQGGIHVGGAISVYGGKGGATGGDNGYWPGAGAAGGSVVLESNSGTVAAPPSITVAGTIDSSGGDARGR